MLNHWHLFSIRGSILFSNVKNIYFCIVYDLQTYEKKWKKVHRKQQNDNSIDCINSGCFSVHSNLAETYSLYNMYYLYSKIWF
jgi:hypothetical protein